jgi:DNA-binding response OmpR family regulator
MAARLRALEAGFDDAIDLDADPLEIAGRLAIAGRSTRFGTAIHVAEGVEFNGRAKVVTRDGKPIHVRPSELELLEFFVTHPGEAFSRQDLVRFALPNTGEESARVIDVYVFGLRSKLEQDPTSPKHFRTIRRVGYRYDPPSPSER